MDFEEQNNERILRWLQSVDDAGADDNSEFLAVPATECTQVAVPAAPAFVSEKRFIAQNNAVLKFPTQMTLPIVQCSIVGAATVRSLCLMGDRWNALADDAGLRSPRASQRRLRLHPP